MSSNPLPADGYFRLAHIVGNPKAKPPIPALVPVGRSTWFRWVRSGRAPKPLKLGPGITCWRVSDVIQFIEEASRE